METDELEDLLEAVRDRVSERSELSEEARNVGRSLAHLPD